MNYTQTIEYLFATTPSFQAVGADAYKPGLERVAEFCRLLETCGYTAPTCLPLCMGIASIYTAEA